jgi:hypothetical protein
MKQIRFKVIIRAYSNGPWSSIIERPVTAVSWAEKPRVAFQLARLAYGRRPEEKPLLFSKAAAEAIVTQLDRFRFAGPGPDGKATAKIIPVEVE